MNLGELQAECGRLLSDPNNNRWSAAILTKRLNDAGSDIQSITNAIKTEEALTPTANVGAVSLDDSTINITRVSIQRSNGNIFPLDGLNREELDFRYPNWQNLDAGEPFAYWYDGSTNDLNLVPPPDSNNVIASGLSVWEVRKPSDMSNPTDIPFDSNTAMVPYHMALVHWAVAQCWMDDGTPEALAKSHFHKSGDIDHPGQYELHLKRIMQNFDSPIDVPTKILWKPQGGRLGMYGMPTKSYPFRY